MKTATGQLYFNQEDETNNFAALAQNLVHLWHNDKQCVNELHKMESMMSMLLEMIDQDYYLIPKDVIQSPRLFVNDNLGTLEPICSPIELIDYGSISQDLAIRYRNLRTKQSVAGSNFNPLSPEYESYKQMHR